MRRFLRYLRIAFSATCLIACVLLIALWVRSQRYDKTARLHGEQVRHLNSQKRLITAWSKLGAIHFCVTRPTPNAEWDTHFAAGRILGFGYLNEGSSSALRIPYWFTIAATCLVAVFPWTPFFSWRFSLRTLLIATTLIAVMLGLIVWWLSR